MTTLGQQELGLVAKRRQVHPRALGRLLVQLLLGDIPGAIADRHDDVRESRGGGGQHRGGQPVLVEQAALGAEQDENWKRYLDRLEAAGHKRKSV